MPWLNKPSSQAFEHSSNGHDFDGLVQDCSNSSALAMELLQSCTKPSTYQSTSFLVFNHKEQRYRSAVATKGTNYNE